MWKCMCFQKRQRLRLFQTIICWTVVSCVIFSAFLVSYNTDSMFKDDDYQVVIDLKNNYFLSLDELKAGRFLVQNDKCNIPDLDIWSRSVQTFTVNQKNQNGQFNCDAKTLNVTYVHNYAVVINEEVLEKAGFLLDDVECCYRIVKRVDQNFSFYDKNADNLFSFSQECHQMEKITIPKGEYIKVKCNAKGLVGRLRFSYTNFHFIPKFPLLQRNGSSLAQKLKFWKECANPNTTNAEYNCFNSAGAFTKPPNVLILGIDSTSRINFRRFMHKTIEFLTSIGAVEMAGYTKVGENTFPNFVPLMSSYSEEELVKICYSDRYKPQDECPYLWKTFSRLNYLTGHLEDAPRMAIFNYMKTGFIKSPVDFYFRPAMLAAYRDNGGDPYTVDCIGNQRPEEHVVNFVVDLVSLAEEKGIPYLITTWLTDLTHEDMFSVQSIDKVLANGLQTLHDRRLLENTVLLVMSDHGYRFLDIRATSSGWYEDKLPSLWIKLPPPITRNHPNWLTNLQYNSRQLTTPFDLHKSLKDIAEYVSEKYKEDKGPRKKADTGAISLFEEHPSRTCDEAMIPSVFCACIPPIQYKSNFTIIKLAGKAVSSYINSRNPPGCTPLKLASITGSGVFHKTDLVKNKIASNSVLQDSLNLVIVFRTRPGHFHFEACLTYNQSNGTFSNIYVLRINKITTSTHCLNDNEMGYEAYCYCK